MKNPSRTPRVVAKPAAKKAAAPATPGRAAGKPLTKAAQTEHTRALILQTGIKCLYKYGYARTSLNLIAKEAGISRGPLHYHFKDPNDLMAAIGAVLPRDVTAQTRRRLTSASNLAERLGTLIDIALEQHSGIHHFVAMELLMAARNDEALAKALRPHLLQSELVVDDWWCDYLQLMRWPRERLLALRSVTVAALRGLSVDYVLHRNDDAHARAVALMREMFLLVAAQPTGATPAEPKARKRA
jgi:AcrR family transcriptional regulator